MGRNSMSCASKESGRNSMSCASKESGRNSMNRHQERSFDWKSKVDTQFIFVASGKHHMLLFTGCAFQHFFLMSDSMQLPLHFYRIMTHFESDY